MTSPTGVCIDDDAFTVSETGVLTPRICGTPARSNWPFTADPANVNGLHLGDCGFWVAPEKKTIALEGYSQHAPNALVTVGTNLGGVPLSYVVANPSADLSMRLVFNVQVKWRVGMTGEAFCVTRVGWAKNDSTPTTEEISSMLRSASTFGGEAGWLSSYVDPVTDVLAPGEVATYYVLFSVTNIVGTIRYISSTHRISGFGITI